MKPEGLHKITVKKGGKTVPHIKPERITYIVEEVAYWRKANQIHKWFVDNVQKGQDDCGEHYVADEKLEKLRDICKEVLDASVLKKGKIQNGYHYENGVKKPIMKDGEYIADPEVAQELLPNQEGFFFGSTDYDEYYLDDVRRTYEVLDALLKEDEETKCTASYYYNSSW